MRYADNFEGYVIVSMSWQEGDLNVYRYVEGKIVDETDNLLTLEDAMVYYGDGILTQCERIILNKGYVDLVDSAKKGDILPIARKKYYKSILNPFWGAMIFILSFIPLLIILGTLFT